MFLHISSVKRKNLNGKEPYEVFSFTYGTSVSNILDIKSTKLIWWFNPQIFEITY